MLKKIASVILLGAMLFTVSCGGTPSADDLRGTVAASGDTVSANVPVVSYFYNDTVLSFLNHYAKVLDKLGLDPSKPLAGQKMQNREETWHEYFLNSTFTLTYHLISLTEAAKAEGISLTDAEINAIRARAERTAPGSYGPNVDNEAVFEARVIEALAYKYQEIKEAELAPTADEIEAHASEKNKKRNEDSTLNIRSVMLFDTGYGSRKAARAKAEELLALLEKDPSENNFTLISLEYSDDPSSCYAGGLYSDFAPGKSIAEIDKWCFEDGRKVGDIALVESDYGCHIIYVESEGLTVWQAEAAAEIVSERFEALCDTVHEKYFVTIAPEAVELIK